MILHACFVLDSAACIFFFLGWGVGGGVSISSCCAQGMCKHWMIQLAGTKSYSSTSGLVKLI